MKKKCLVLALIAVMIFLQTGCGLFSKDKDENADIENTKPEETKVEETKLPCPYTFDETDPASAIDKDGEYIDSAGISYTKYFKSGHFEFYYRKLPDYVNENFDKELIVLEEKYETFAKFFGIKEGDYPPIKIYITKDKDELVETLEKLQGVKNDYLQEAVTPNSIYLDEFSSVEYSLAEAMVMSQVRGDKMPIWVVTGTSDYLCDDPTEFAYERFNNNFLNSVTRNFTQADVDKMVDNRLQAGKYAYTLVDYIAKKYGDDAVRKLLSNGGDVKDALGIDFETLGADWIKHSGESVPASVYVNDETDYIGLIESKGFFEDEAGHKLNAYLKNDHFEFYYDKASFEESDAQNALDFIESKYNEVLDFVGVKEEEMPVVKINMYPDYEQINELDNFAVYAGGVSIANRFFYGNLKGSEKYCNTTLLHEFVHNVHMTKINLIYPEKTYYNSWFIEGLATYAEAAILGEAYFEDLTSSKKSAGLPLSAEKNELIVHDYSNNYSYGFYIIDQIVSTYGKSKLDELICDLSSFETIMGKSYEEYSKEWVEYIKNRG